MAQLIVRNIDEDIVLALKERAGRRGHSAEEEHRRILREALISDAVDPKAILLAMPDVGSDSDFERVPGEPRAVDL